MARTLRGSGYERVAHAKARGVAFLNTFAVEHTQV